MQNMRFDRHDWNAPVYATHEEIYDALKSFRLSGKRIKEIHTIGMAENMEKWACSLDARRKLASAGVPYEDIDSGKYPHFEKTVLPCRVRICEPVVFVFEDNSTFELMPCGKSGLRMSVNKISPHILDGTNFHNFDSTKLFARIIGSSFKEVQTCRTEIKKKWESSPCDTRHSKTKYQFWLTGDFGIFFEQSWEGWFDFGLTDQSSFSYDGNVVAGTTYGELRSAQNDKIQVPIVEGHDGSSYFWIMPVKHVPKTEQYWRAMQEYRPEEISIEEDHVLEFLYYFLDKYFDENYPYGDCRDECDGSGFEWNLEYNIYTYDAINAMLKDIEEFCERLKTNYDDPSLDELKKRFSVYTFEPDCPYCGWPTEEEKELLIRRNIYVATEFYERFVYRMRAMMANAKEYTLISFMGP